MAFLMFVCNRLTKKNDTLIFRHGISFGNLSALEPFGLSSSRKKRAFSELPPIFFQFFHAALVAFVIASQFHYWLLKSV